MSMTSDLRTRPATRLSSARMRNEHQRLLEMASDENPSLGPLTREHLMQFVHEVASTGTLLRHSDERRVAQGVLDYWVATLNANSPNLEMATTAPEPVSIRLARFDAAALDELIASAGVLASELGTEGETVMLALLMALLEADDSRRRLVLVVQAREHWIATCTAALSLDVEKVAAVADRLIAAGLVLETTLPTPPSPVVELVAHGLTEAWQPLAAAVQARLQRRERMSQVGNQVGLLDASLAILRGHSAERNLPALDPSERQFEEHRVRRQRLAFLMMGVLLVVAMGVIVLLTHLLVTESQLRSQATILSLQASGARLVAEQQRVVAEEQTALAREQAERANALATEAQQQVTTLNLERERLNRERALFRQAIAQRDARALVGALDAAGISIPDDVIAFRDAPPAQPDQSPSLAVEPQTASARPPPSRSNTDQTICSGAIWLGPQQRNVRGAPSPTDGTWAGRNFVTAAPLNLRRGPPDPITGLPEPIGLIPAGTSVMATGEPLLDRRPRVPTQYFLPVNAPGPTCVTVFFQFFGSRERAQAISTALQEDGYRIPGLESLRSAQGLSEIRYYFDEDRTRANDLAARTTSVMDHIPGLGGRSITARDYTDWQRTKPPRGTVELWLDVSGQQD